MNRNRHWSQIPLLAAECWSLRAPEAKNTSTTAPICSPGAQRARVRAFRRRARAQCDRCPRAPLIRFSTAAAHATRMVYEPAGARARSSRQGSDSVFLTALKHPDITDRDRTTHRHSTRSLRATRRPATHAATRDTARRLTRPRAARRRHRTRTRAEQCWISGIRAVRTAALPSAMPVISVALKPHGRINRARNIAKAIAFVLPQSRHGITQRLNGPRPCGARGSCGREPRAPDVLVHVSAVLLAAQTVRRRQFAFVRRYTRHDIPVQHARHHPSGTMR